MKFIKWNPVYKTIYLDEGRRKMLEFYDKIANIQKDNKKVKKGEKLKAKALLAHGVTMEKLGWERELGEPWEIIAERMGLVKECRQ